MSFFKALLRVSGTAVFLIIFAGAFLSVTSSNSYAGDDRLELGRKVYEMHCFICHGEKGNGKGSFFAVVQENSAADGVYPRDFTTGVFKLRSTPTGCLPTSSDIQRIIDMGILRSYMPAHSDLSEDEMDAVAEYIKTFFAEWDDMTPCEPVTSVKPAWVGTKDSVVKGEKLWNTMKCWECHGNEGKGDGPKSNDLKDDWGKQIIPYDFTSGASKRGDAPEDIYMAYTTGLDGSSMPSYQDSMSEEERWHLVSFTLKLMGRVK